MSENWLRSSAYSLLTDTNNISKPTFRSCRISVTILYASFRQAVPIFRFVGIFLISVGSALSVFPETTSTRLAPRRAGGGGRLGMNGIDSRCCAAAVTQITFLGDELSWRSALGRSQWDPQTVVMVIVAWCPFADVWWWSPERDRCHASERER